MAEQHGAVFVKQGVDHTASALQSGGNMEGKEVRFGIANSALWATATTAASNGSVNSMHDSYTPIGGLVPMWLMQLGEVVFGGVGSGLYGMLVFAIIAVFVAGLMVGRTPEYLGKKIEAYEMKMSSLVILIPPALVLIGTAVGGRHRGGQGGRSRTRARTASARSSTRSRRRATTTAAPSPGSRREHALLQHRARPRHALRALLAGRPGARDRGLARPEEDRPGGPGTLPTHTPLFVALLIGVVVLVGALTFVPALALGPDRRAPHARRGEVRRASMAGTVTVRSLFDPTIVRQAVIDSFRKLTPARQVRNPVMFVVYVGSILTTLLWIQALVGTGEAPACVHLLGVGLALVHRALRQLRRGDGGGTRQGAGRLAAQGPARSRGQAPAAGRAATREFDIVSAVALRKGDLVLVEAGDFIPADGTVVEGVASVNEAAITGESAPVIREAGGDRSSVTGGTQVLSDWIVVRGHRRTPARRSSTA